jgi:hypothetical protein
MGVPLSSKSKRYENEKKRPKFHGKWKHSLGIFPIFSGNSFDKIPSLIF